MSLSHVLYTKRLRLEPVTAEVIVAANRGRAALEASIDAAIDDGWRGEHVFGAGRSTTVDSRPRHMLIIHEVARSLIGEVRFEPLRGGEGFEIGYAIASGWRRQGFATEATAAVIKRLEDHGAMQIIAGCAMSNKASIRTLRKLGFDLDGSSARSNAFWWVRRPGA
jgi:[ribosomal protein S5]-alanine N-acetyltransferase